MVEAGGGVMIWKGGGRAQFLLRTKVCGVVHLSLGPRTRPAQGRSAGLGTPLAPPLPRERRCKRVVPRPDGLACFARARVVHEPGPLARHSQHSPEGLLPERLALGRRGAAARSSAGVEDGIKASEDVTRTRDEGGRWVANSPVRPARSRSRSNRGRQGVGGSLPLRGEPHPQDRLSGGDGGSGRGFR